MSRACRRSTQREGSVRGESMGRWLPGGGSGAQAPARLRIGRRRHSASSVRGDVTRRCLRACRIGNRVVPRCHWVRDSLPRLGTAGMGHRWLCSIRRGCMRCVPSVPAQGIGSSRDSRCGANPVGARGGGSRQGGERRDTGNGRMCAWRCWPELCRQRPGRRRRRTPGLREGELR
jgi:hypothetical protein